jgi:hypothetical protein
MSVKCVKCTFNIIPIFQGLAIMSDSITIKSDEAADNIDSEDTAILRTVSHLLVPLARLCLANGITFAAAEEVLKRSFVQEANALQPGAAQHGMVSRISTATGINRREVTRLTKLKAPERATKQPLAAEILARWTTDPSYRNQDDGVPIVLNRLGPVPSFEALAQTVTRDIHHRSMLDELIRLDLVSYDENVDRVALTRNDFVPRCDSQQMLTFLGDNVGDHLNAAIANVLHDGYSHLEQAVFADELSTESIVAIRPLVIAHWKALREDLVPAITALIEADKLAGRSQDQRVRIGLYTFTDTTTDSKPSQKCRVARRFRKPATKDTPK